MVKFTTVKSYWQVNPNKGKYRERETTMVVDILFFHWLGNLLQGHMPREHHRWILAGNPAQSAAKKLHDISKIFMSKESTKVTVEMMQYMPHHKSGTCGDASLNSRCSLINILQLNRAPIVGEQSSTAESLRALCSCHNLQSQYCRSLKRRVKPKALSTTWKQVYDESLMLWTRNRALLAAEK